MRAQLQALGTYGEDLQDIASTQIIQELMREAQRHRSKRNPASKTVVASLPEHQITEAFL